MSTTTAIKLFYKDQIRRVPVNQTPFTFQHLKETISVLFPLFKSEDVQYIDSEGDHVSVTTDMELQEAFAQNTNSILRVYLKESNTKQNQSSQPCNSAKQQVPPSAQNQTEENEDYIQNAQQAFQLLGLSPSDAHALASEYGSDIAHLVFSGQPINQASSADTTKSQPNTPPQHYFTRNFSPAQTRYCPTPFGYARPNFYSPQPGRSGHPRFGVFGGYANPNAQEPSTSATTSKSQIPIGRCRPSAPELCTMNCAAQKDCSRNDLMKYKISELKQKLSQRGISSEGMLEKGELVDKILSVLSSDKGISVQKVSANKPSSTSTSSSTSNSAPNSTEAQPDVPVPKVGSEANAEEATNNTQEINGVTIEDLSEEEEAQYVPRDYPAPVHEQLDTEEPDQPHSPSDEDHEQDTVEHVEQHDQPHNAQDTVEHVEEPEQLHNKQDTVEHVEEPEQLYNEQDTVEHVDEVEDSHPELSESQLKFAQKIAENMYPYKSQVADKYVIEEDTISDEDFSRFMAAKAISTPPKHPFVEKLEILEQMGFVDKNENIKTLVKNKGDVTAAINELLSSL